MQKYPEFKQLNLTEIAGDVLNKWQKENTFEQSVAIRKGAKDFTFYEGPPSANGMPGIHHVMARAIKDIFCRYKTLKGFRVKRKGGWDTHGLPIELSVEKTLGIRKSDIGKTISVEDYNKACRVEVMKYKDAWDELTRQMGYWVDLGDPYITFTNDYIETCWYLLSQLYKKNLLYKGYAIQPYSPAAGTGLSSHELNQPGTYREVKDRTVVAMFQIKEPLKALQANNAAKKLNAYFLAWTTTPWTLPSNTALAVGKNIEYKLVHTFHPTSKKHEEVIVVVAADLLSKYFPEKNAALSFNEYKPGDKAIPFNVIASVKGNELMGMRYEQLLPFAQPVDGDAFKVVVGDFVTTEDGTGIVHIAPSFGADDFRVAKQNGIGSLTLVDKRGKFLPEVQDGVFLYGEEFVKEDYLNENEKATELSQQKEKLKSVISDTSKLQYLSVDERIALKLQEEGKLFKKEIYAHNYPHCWRTDKPVLYYPLDSWFIRTTAAMDRMIELNKTIQWKPESTGTGRFGNWLENLVDWNLSRSRFWGIPLPIWRSEDGSEEICIQSVEHLHNEIEKSVAAGFMNANDYPKQITDSNIESFDLHRPYIDNVVLVSPSGKKMTRETDLIDVWFDSGAMPYAQWGLDYKKIQEGNPFPFGEGWDGAYPADFIAEGVDQTRGWFFTLHAIAVLLFDSVAFKNVVSNGLVLDKNGNKMSKRLGNAVDPFETLKKFGPDATRWYMITNASPWDNLKFDIEGIAEKQRSVFSTLYNTYNFFALYANIDGYTVGDNEPIRLSERSELDRWVISSLHSLIKVVEECYENYDPTPAGRAIEKFIDENLSNWYVRLSRRRFWKGELTKDKMAAYQTLHECLLTLSQLMSPIAPFFSEWLYGNITSAQTKNKETVYSSVHHTLWPVSDQKSVDAELEERMQYAQTICSMVLSVRKKENLRVRQPLQRLRIPVLNAGMSLKIESVKSLILAEVNVKEIEFVDEQQAAIVKNLKLNFKTLGKKYGKLMKALQQHAADHSIEVISSIETNGQYKTAIDGEEVTLLTEDVEIIPVDIPGWKVANQGHLTVALDVNITPQLREEGLAREFVNRIQNLRKDKGLEVTDRITLKVQNHDAMQTSLVMNKDYICAEILATSLEIADLSRSSEAVAVEVEENISMLVEINKN